MIMNNQAILKINITILSFISILTFILMRIMPDKIMFINAIFWIILGFIIYRYYGIKRNKGELKKNAVSIVIIGVLLYTLFSFLSGLYFGFLRNGYSLEIKMIIKNIYSLVIMIIAEEYIKGAVIKKNNRIGLIILTIFYSILDILLIGNISKATSNVGMFLFITNSLIPILIRNILSSYICYHYGSKGAIIYRLFFTIYIYLFPILPNWGDYLNSVIALLVPFFIYLGLSSLDNKEPRNVKRKGSIWLVPLVILTFIMVGLVANLFTYRIMAIASGSMEPTFSRGDAIIYEVIKDKDQLQRDDIIVFRHDGIFITHRIANITIQNNKRYYTTKGDNNNDVDSFILKDEDIVGIMRLKFKYLGQPSLWFNEYFKR